MSALALRILACVCMLLDHIGLVFPRLHMLRFIGRLAFPIYVFLIVNGYRHTSSPLRYGLRLGFCALLSQIPFDLFCGNTVYFLSLNVFFTLLLALLVLWATDALLKRKVLRYFAFLPVLLVGILYLKGYIHSDYGLKGILLALCFRYLLDKPLLLLPGSFLSLFYPQLIHIGQWLLGRRSVFPYPSAWDLTQLFALLALIPIFLYNGKKGWQPKRALGAKVLQWSFYLFYPAHLLLLHLLS